MKLVYLHMPHSVTPLLDMHRLLPRQASLPKMAIGRGLLEYRPSQAQTFDNGPWPEVEMFAYQTGQ
jgi:hypothetical protein